MRILTKEYTLDGSGTEIDNFDVEDVYEQYIVNGTAIAIGNYNISIVGTPTKNDTFIVKWNGYLDITTNSATFAILGTALTQNDLSQDSLIICNFNGTTWKVIVLNNTNPCCELYTEISLSSAQILNINSTPQTLVAAPGVGYIIRPIDFISKYTYGTTTYATNVFLRAYYNTSTNYYQIADISKLTDYMIINRSSDIVPLENKSIKITEPSGNPTTGDGTIIIGIWYKIIAI